MFTNSLFKDFMMENGMKDWKGESTRDIICLEFNYGTRSYEEEIEHLMRVAKEARTEYKIAKSQGAKIQIESKKNKRRKISELIKEANENKDKYIKYSKDEIRKLFYNEGVDVEYITRKKSGEIIKREIIHYKMLYRSTGKAKKGSCMFIKANLHKRAQNFLYMGIKLPKKNAMLVEISAYAPLVSSAIVGKVQIDPSNILVLKDVDREYITDVISVEINDNKNCLAKQINDYHLKNTMFDGQALIDSSIFPSWGHGYVLLRHHFCKMAAFNTNIQQFYKDYFGSEYETATVEDMWGNIHLVKDIRLITTENAMKWIKFDKSYEYWSEWVRQNGCNFGIVKTAHQSKLGSLQKMSYQMVNSLDWDSMPNVVGESVEYVNRLKTDIDFFLDYLDRNQNFSNDFAVLVDLVKHNPEFVQSSYFRERKRAIIMSYVMNMKSGKLLQNAENLVIVGSPYAMLLYSTCGDESIVDTDDTLVAEEGCIQCFTSRFDDGEYLAEFRSPFNGKYNLGYMHNHYDDKMFKYFNFSPEIVAVNMNGTDFQDRNNGSDQDSDSCYTTNQSEIVEHAQRCQNAYRTIVNNIPKDTNKYNNSLDDYANIDNKLAASQLDIGESSNLAQIAQTYDCTFGDQKYKDYVCILSVLAQAAIDNAKRQFDVNISDEIRRIKKDMSVKTNGYPEFWGVIKKDFNKSNINEDLSCPMNYLASMKMDQFRDTTPTIPMSYYLNKYELEKNRKTCKKVEELIERYSDALNEYNITNSQYQTTNFDTEGQYLLLRADYENLVSDISKIYISSNYKGLFSWLLDRAFTTSPQLQSNQYKVKSKIRKNRSVLMKILYDVNSKNLIECLSKNVKK